MNNFLRVYYQTFEMRPHPGFYDLPLAHNFIVKVEGMGLHQFANKIFKLIKVKLEQLSIMVVG